MYKARLFPFQKSLLDALCFTMGWLLSKLLRQRYPWKKDKVTHIYLFQEDIVMLDATIKLLLDLRNARTDIAWTGRKEEENG